MVNSPACLIATTLLPKLELLAHEVTEARKSFEKMSSNISLDWLNELIDYSGQSSTLALEISLLCCI